MGEELKELTDYLTGADIIRNIKSNEQGLKQRNLLEITRDYAAYGVTVSQRFAPHATIIFGLERVVEGKYEQGVLALVSIPLLSLLNRKFFPSGEEIIRSKAVVDYLVGADIPDDIIAREQIADKISKRSFGGNPQPKRIVFNSLVFFSFGK